MLCEAIFLQSCLSGDKHVSCAEWVIAETWLVFLLEPMCSVVQTNHIAHGPRPLLVRGAAAAGVPQVLMQVWRKLLDLLQLRRIDKFIYDTAWH